jgi:chromate transporter
MRIEARENERRMAPADAPANPATPSFSEALRFWAKLGLISFGGPAGQIAIMHEELVERKRWVSEERFLHALNFCMLLPGPEAQQLAIYIGWLLHRAWGGIVAGALFVLPSAVVLWALAFAYMALGERPAAIAILAGLQPAVIAIVAAAILRIGSKALKNGVLWMVAGLSFVALFFGKVPFPYVIFAAGLVGIVGVRLRPAIFAVPRIQAAAPSDPIPAREVRGTPIRALKIMGLCLGLWSLPIVAVGVWLGWDGILFREGLFFSKTALLTFGGAYAILPFVAQKAVMDYGWLTANQMLAGLALAETTPGPLIMVLQFVGFVAGWQHPGPLDPLVAATLGAAVTTWATFLPSFLFVFLGAPHMERLRENRSLQAALAVVSAAVVGVILNLAVWFGFHVLAPVNQPFNWFGLVLAGLLFAGMKFFRWSVLSVIVGAALCGVARWLFLGAG